MVREKGLSKTARGFLLYDFYVPPYPHLTLLWLYCQHTPAFYHPRLPAVAIGHKWSTVRLGAVGHVVVVSGSPVGGGIAYFTGS